MSKDQVLECEVAAGATAINQDAKQHQEEAQHRRGSISGHGAPSCGRSGSTFCRPSTCLQLGSSSAQEVVARSGRPFTSSAQQRGLADPGPTLDDKDAASPDDRLDRGELALTLQEVHGGTTVKTPKPSAHTYCTATPLRSRSRKGSIFGAGRRKDQGAHPVASTRTLT